MYLFFLKDDEDSSDSDEDGQAFYAGGSETSGQQILGPAKKKDGADFVKHMFKKAKEHGAEAVDPSAGPQASGSRSVFTGAGMTLGSNGKSQTLVNIAPKYATPHNAMKRVIYPSEIKSLPLYL